MAERQARAAEEAKARRDLLDRRHEEQFSNESSWRVREMPTE